MGALCSGRPAEGRAPNCRKELLCFFNVIVITVGLRIWILMVDHHNIYYEIAAGLATFFVLCIVAYRIRRTLQDRQNQPFPAVEPLRVFSLHSIIGGGLSAEAIDALPQAIVQNGKLRMNGVYQDVDEELSCHVSSCSICLADFAEEQVVLCLPCRHAFHRECLRSWLQRKNLCPLCKSPAAQSHPPRPGMVVLTNEDSSFFIHDNIVYSSAESIQLSSPRTAPAHASSPVADSSQV